MHCVRVAQRPAAPEVHFHQHQVLAGQQATRRISSSLGEEILTEPPVDSASVENFLVEVRVEDGVAVGVGVAVGEAEVSAVEADALAGASLGRQPHGQEAEEKERAERLLGR